MKQLRFHLVIVGALLCMLSAAAAIEYQPLVTEEGVEAMVSYDPLGPNNQIVAYVKFVNSNSYKVDVDWRPVITCEGTGVVRGAGGGFSIDAKSTFEVTLWRSMACGLRQIKNLNVRMNVKKSTGF